MADSPEAGEVCVVAGPSEAGERADRLLAARIEGLTRSRIQTLIRQAAVEIDGRTLGDAGYRVKPGDTFLVRVPPPEPAVPQGETIALEIVHEDPHLIVVDKPAGLVVHPAAGHATGTLVNALIAHCGDSLSGIGGIRRPGIVHRLDKDTSGLLVVAKTDAAHQGLSDQFAAHGRDGRLHRRYLALVWGAPYARRGTIEAALGRSASERTKMAVRPTMGREAVTRYEVLETFAGEDGRPLASLVALELETGRTHQIRVHMAHIGHPVMGDPVYGAGFKASARRMSHEAQAALTRLGRQALHAAELGFEHPVTGKAMRFESALPADMAALLRALQADQPQNARSAPPRPAARDKARPRR